MKSYISCWFTERSSYLCEAVLNLYIIRIYFFIYSFFLVGSRVRKQITYTLKKKKYFSKRHPLTRTETIPGKGILYYFDISLSLRYCILQCTLYLLLNLIDLLNFSNENSSFLSVFSFSFFLFLYYYFLSIYNIFQPNRFWDEFLRKWIGNSCFLFSFMKLIAWMKLVTHSETQYTAYLMISISLAVKKLFSSA